MRISDWSSDVCSSDLSAHGVGLSQHLAAREHGGIVYVPSKSGDEQNRNIGVGMAKHCRHFRAGHVGYQNVGRSEEHTSELQSLMRISYAVFCLKKKTKEQTTHKI